jgi:hypothetical protein
MKTNLKRKNYYLDQNKVRRARAISETNAETEAIDAALSLVVFRKEILKSLEKVAGKGGSRRTSQAVENDAGHRPILAEVAAHAAVAETGPGKRPRSAPRQYAGGTTSSH